MNRIRAKKCLLFIVVFIIDMIVKCFFLFSNITGHSEDFFFDVYFAASISIDTIIIVWLLIPVLRVLGYRFSLLMMMVYTYLFITWGVEKFNLLPSIFRFPFAVVLLLIIFFVLFRIVKNMSYEEMAQIKS